MTDKNETTPSDTLAGITSDAEKERLVPLDRLAAIYPRQSKTDESDVESGRSLSSENQIRRCEAYCTMHGLYALLDLSRASVDLDQSGGAKLSDRRKGTRTWQRRPGLMRLLEGAKAGRFRHLICYDLNRLGGNDVELHLIREAFDDAGVTLHIVEQGIRTDTDAGRTMYGIFCQFAHQRLKDISTTARGSAHTRASQGKHHGRPPEYIEIIRSVATTPEELAVEVAARGPRGTLGWYRLHPVHAETLRMLVRYRLAGLSYGQIARRLNDPTQEGGARSTFRGHPWTVALVCAFLAGDSRLRMRGHSVYGWGLPPGDPKRIVTLGVFPPLFGDEETPRLIDALDAAQIAYRDRNIPFGKTLNPDGTRPTFTRSPRIFAKTEHLLSGILYCHICGTRMGTSQSGAKHRQYYCRMAAVSGVNHPTYQSNPTGAESRGMYIGSHRLEAAVYHALALLAVRLKGLGWTPLAASLQAVAAAKKAKGAIGGVKPPKRGIEEITKAIDALLELYLAGRLKQADYDRKYAELVKERADVEAYHAARVAGNAQQAALTLLAETFPTSSDSESCRPTTAALRVLLIQLTDRVEVPITYAGEYHRAGRQHWEVEHIRLYLKSPLPDGVRAVVSGLYQHNYAGPRRVILEDDSPPPKEPILLPPK